MEESKANLSLDDDEEETIQLGVESSHREASYGNCFVGMFLTSSVVNIQAMRLMLENDISLRAQSKRNVAWRSRWLVEDGGDGSSNYGNSTNMYGGRNLRRSQSIPVDQGANVGFPPKISFSLKGKSNIS
ncbi:hypothetical protein Gotri_022744 [Gossypium trilobum]|uniref:Uncharacterized protein n=1 Tax=Gossypium trilobum TaxID=34281 RepID=A0A7J9DH91_9ROSI|nr:hypothetical protein [Gossypium trilobum]